MKPMNRRDSFRKIVGIFTRTLAGAFVLSPTRLSAGARKENRLVTQSISLQSSPLQGLLQSLQATGNSTCLTEAERLSKLAPENEERLQTFDLALRSAKLNLRDAQIIADGIRSLPDFVTSKLGSFSASYNTTLTQAGITTLISALPPSLTDLGMVGCDMNDESAAVLLQWANRASGLKVICIEQNNLSTKVKQQFTALRHSNKDLLVVV